MWTEKEVGEYLAATLQDTDNWPVIGDPIRGFGLFTQVTEPMIVAFVARLDDLAKKRREYLKAQRKRNRASKRGLGAIDFKISG